MDRRVEKIAIPLSIENENKYYSDELTNEDIRDELLANGFKLKGAELLLDGRELKSAILYAKENFEVFINVEVDRNK